MSPRLLFVIAGSLIVVTVGVVVLRLTVVAVPEPVFLGTLFVLVGGAFAAYLSARARGGRIRVRGSVDEVPLAPVAVRDVVEPATTPWPLEAVATAIAAAFEGAPYRVLAGADRIRIMTDEQDDRFWRGLTLSTPDVVQHWDLVARGDALTLVEGIDDVDWPVRPGTGEPMRAPIRRGQPRVPSGLSLHGIEELAVSFRLVQARHEGRDTPSGASSQPRCEQGSSRSRIAPAGACGGAGDASRACSRTPTRSAPSTDRCGHDVGHLSSRSPRPRSARPARRRRLQVQGRVGVDAARRRLTLVARRRTRREGRYDETPCRPMATPSAACAASSTTRSRRRASARCAGR